jgi:hypothetical protein
MIYKKYTEEFKREVLAMAADAASVGSTASLGTLKRADVPAPKARPSTKKAAVVVPCVSID